LGAIEFFIDHVTATAITLHVNLQIKFIKVTPENPVLWTGMKGVSAKGRKNLNQMLKRVQHDNRG
jgi:hypothetical protein